MNEQIRSRQEQRGPGGAAARSRGQFLRQAGLVAGGVAVLSAATFTSAFAATDAACPDTTSDILNAALTAEQLATTFYYNGLLASTLPKVHSNANLNYFQAALWQEYQHASLFASVGATTLAGGSPPQFYFPTNVFVYDAVFLGVLDVLETIFIAAYTAAIGAWAGDAPNAVSSTGSFTGPQLAKIAGQILGTEAEHRALGRVAQGVNPPNNLIVERAPFECVGSPTNSSGTAVGALLPFVTGGNGFTGPYVLPGATDISTAASPYNTLVFPPLAQP